MTLLRLNDPDFRPVRTFTCWVCREPHPAEGPERVVLIRGLLIRGLLFCESCLRMVVDALAPEPAAAPPAESTDTS